MNLSTFCRDVQQAAPQTQLLGRNFDKHALNCEECKAGIRQRGDLTQCCEQGKWLLQKFTTALSKDGAQRQ